MHGIIKKVIGFVQLLRIQQYYKNFILFAGIIFAKQLNNFSIYPNLLLAFLLFCLSSSMTYILNDIHDRDADRLHPEKMKNRPLANGTLSTTSAWVLFCLIGSGIILLILFSPILQKLSFLMLIVLFFLNGLLYNYVFKKIPFVDIIGLSTLYVWRALAGCDIIEVDISPWLTITVFLIALLLANGKRIADLQLLGEENAKKHKKIYDSYSSQLLDSFLIVIATSLFVTYTLYCVLGPKEVGTLFPIENQRILTYTIPVALYLIFRYLYLVRKEPIMARNALYLIKDKGMIIAGIVLGVIIILTIYI